MSFDDGNARQTRRSDLDVRPGSDFLVTLALSVNDARALWKAAASRLVDVSGLALEDVVELIGPEEDPSPADCITALMTPVVFAGCTPNALSVENVGHRSRRSAQERPADPGPSDALARHGAKLLRKLPSALASASNQPASAQSIGARSLQSR